MRLRPVRHLFSILFAIAFLSATTLQAVTAVAMPMNADMQAGMTMAAPDGTPDSAPTPCKGMTPACMIDLGCIFMVGVPTPVSRVAVHLAWSSVSYQWPADIAADGSIRAPDLRPPIRLI